MTDAPKDDAYVATPMHGECVACHARSTEADAEAATLTILAVLRHGFDPDQIHRDLCFAHRRAVEDCARGMS